MQLDQQYKCRIAELTTQNKDKTTAGWQENQEQISKVLEAKDRELEVKDKELAAKDKECHNLDEEVKKLCGIVTAKGKECTKLNKALQECEGRVLIFS
jgi:DNA anti-recombination protein RmuC